MKFEELVSSVGELPLFRGSLLLAGDRDPADVRRQLSRWEAAGRIVQLRRDVYVLAEPWRRVKPHPFYVANELHRPSYVSLQSALSFHGMIPEAVAVTTSVTLARPITLDTPLGGFSFRHVRDTAFFGYRRETVMHGQATLVAEPEKALLDLVYLTPGGDDPAYIEALRLEGLRDVAEQDLLACAERWGKPKLHRAVDAILELRERE